MKPEIELHINKKKIWLLSTLVTIVFLIAVSAFNSFTTRPNEMVLATQEDPTEEYVKRMLYRSADTREQITYFIEAFTTEDADMEEVDNILSKVIMYSTAPLPSPPTEFEGSHTEYEGHMETLRIATHDLKKAILNDNQEKGMSAITEMMTTQDYLYEHFETVLSPYVEEEEL